MREKTDLCRRRTEGIPNPPADPQKQRYRSPRDRKYNRKRHIRIFPCSTLLSFVVVSIFSKSGQSLSPAHALRQRFFQSQTLAHVADELRAHQRLFLKKERLENARFRILPRRATRAAEALLT